MKEAACKTDLGPLTKKLLEQQQVIERLTAERDEARREVCRWAFKMPQLQRKLAMDRAWDCWKKEDAP
jgi:hypothetical protein